VAFSLGTAAGSRERMKFSRATLANCSQAAGAVVVIDVLRAFSTAAYAFAAGVSEIILTREVSEALALREQFPGALVAGEVGGFPVAGFDFGNSPYAMVGLDLGGRRLIQRTSAGTQGAVLSSQAEHLLACSFVCAAATARMIRKLEPPQVTFVLTEYGREGGGDEDAACADYLEALLNGQTPPVEPFLQRVRGSQSAQALSDPSRPDNAAIDIDYCTQVDRFDFAMQACRENGLLVLRRKNPD